MRFVSRLDKEFKPIYLEYREFLAEANEPLGLCVERNNGYNYIFNLKISGNNEKSRMFAERLVKSMLWAVGGFKVYVQGNEGVFNHLKQAYSSSGVRSFDAQFMSKVYGEPFEVVRCNTLPAYKPCIEVAGSSVDGCRIGFDAGGSDRKVSAVVNGEVVFSEEVVWFPKTNSNPEYHYNGIVSALKRASSKMPRVDGIGISSAGIYINNLTCVASLFLSVPESRFNEVRDIYVRAAKEIGDIPLRVANDGDVTAIAGSISLGVNRVLGIAMGTSEAGGYVNADGGLNGWLTELAFVPCDVNPQAELDAWSGDIGTGVNYFSQDAVIRLAPKAGIELDSSLSPAEKLKVVQELMALGDARAREIYHCIGIYLGYTLPFYAMFYDISHVLVLGRVLSGEGGNLIVEVAKQVLAEEFAELDIKIVTPDEKFKRVGQSIAVSSIVKI